MVTKRALMAWVVTAGMLGCGAQPKQVVVATPSDDEIAIEVIPPPPQPTLGEAGLPVVAKVANLKRDLSLILERAAPRHPMAMMARMGLRAALSGAIGPELAGSVDLSAPMAGGLVQVGDDSVLLVAAHVLDGAAERLKEGLGTEPMASDFVKLVGAAGGQSGQADLTLGSDYFCALGPEPKAVLVCADQEAGLATSGAALLQVLSGVRDDVALQIRYDQQSVADAAGEATELDTSLSELSPLFERLEFNGKLEQGVVELRIVPDGFEISFANLGVLGDDVVSRMLMAPPAFGESLPPMFEGPADTLSVLTFRGLDLAPLKAELGQLQGLLESLVEDPQAKQNLSLMGDLPWPGGPFVIAHGHDLVETQAALEKEFSRRRPRQSDIDAATSGYLLVGVKAPLSDVSAIVAGLERIQTQQAAGGTPAGVELSVAKRTPRSLKLPKGSMLLELTVHPDADEAGAGAQDAEGPETWQAVLAGAGDWSWLVFSKNRALAAARAKQMAAGKGELPQAGRAALRPAGVGQASMLGYFTLASGASLALPDDLEEDPEAALAALKEALAEPEFGQRPVPVRVVVDTAEDKRFRVEAHIKLATPLVAAVIARFAN